MPTHNQSFVRNIIANHLNQQEVDEQWLALCELKDAQTDTEKKKQVTGCIGRNLSALVFGKESDALMEYPDKSYTADDLEYTITESDIDIYTDEINAAIEQTIGVSDAVQRLYTSDDLDDLVEQLPGGIDYSKLYIFAFRWFKDQPEVEHLTCTPVSTILHKALAL